jgi:CRP-like cAMP-binding protein
VFLELPARLAKRLLLLGEHFGFDAPKGRRLTVSLPQRELAAHMGVSRESVNRLLQDWIGRELIEIDRGVLVLKDRPALGRIAGLDSEP